MELQWGGGGGVGQPKWGEEVIKPRGQEIQKCEDTMTRKDYVLSSQIICTMRKNLFFHSHQ